MVFNEYVDRRAKTEMGAAIYIKKTVAQGAGTAGKYSLFLPITEMPALGSAPDQVETTVTTALSKTYTPARPDNPQIEVTAFAHRDNYTKLADWRGEQADFLFVNPDFTGFARSGYISYYQDAAAVGDKMTMKFVITVTDATELATLNVYDLVEDTNVFTSTIPEIVQLVVAGTQAISVIANPSTATLTATSDDTDIATVVYADGVATITAVAAGSCTIDIKAAASTGYAENHTYVLVIVTAAPSV